jgi:hypothetical protein
LYSRRSKKNLDFDFFCGNGKGLPEAKMADKNVRVEERQKEDVAVKQLWSGRSKS